MGDREQGTSLVVAPTDAPGAAGEVLIDTVERDMRFARTRLAYRVDGYRQRDVPLVAGEGNQFLVLSS